jgi:ribosomal protein S18 acetylase RimI-like enzyme
MNDVLICDLMSTELDQVSCVTGRVASESDRDILRRASGGDIAVFGLFHDDKLVGKGGADFTVATDAARIWMVNIREEFRSQGLGTALMSVLEEVSSERGYDEAELLVEIVNVRAKAWYERLGYRITGEETDVVYDRDSAGNSERRDVMCYVMRKSLIEGETESRAGSE